MRRRYGFTAEEIVLVVAFLGVAGGVFAVLKWGAFLAERDAHMPGQ